MMRRVLVSVLALLPLAFAAPATTAATTAATAPSTVSFRVLSFNIHAGIGADGALDLDRTAAAVRATGADVVGLQEVDVHWDARSDFRDQARDLARALRMHVFFAPIYDLPPLAADMPRRRYGVAVLSRFPVPQRTNHEITRLSTQEENPVPAPAPGFAEAVVLVRGVPVHVYSTHLDYRADPSVRELQVADTLRILGTDGPRAAQVLLGDLNAPPAAPELAPLWTVLSDAAPDGATYPATAPEKRIDYVAVSARVGVRSASVPDTLASDHRPVFAELTVRR